MSPTEYWEVLAVESARREARNASTWRAYLARLEWEMLLFWTRQGDAE